MTDLSREELRAHLSAVEAQVRAALRIVAAESKSVQQAHSALRADLSAALIRLQSEMNDGNKRVDGKLERAITEINGLSRQRRMTAAILTTLVLLFGITLGLFAGGGWYLFSRGGQYESSFMPSSGQQTTSQQSSSNAAPTSSTQQNSTSSATGSSTSIAIPSNGSPAATQPVEEPRRVLSAQ
ncbi:MAG: hypothetical protein CMM78_09205 [Rhodospirillaceae bacterium]|jgi:hypothetical protein|uniref:hypothetical protein n=1 Tax=Hwanghaeella sp. 1Z406 TaxID=3402811 RepID=UPI000C3EAE24|nr:hypothetical protein [Rhodospirillales bacterium]MAX48372.1 hypothetical protein [Rhodospirillaceae bacterium]|tara:strand:- start:70368 stop:70916 length:549 start_codon:yes stop_codon:yes gene_type:complete